MTTAAETVERISERLGLGTLRHNELWGVAVEEVQRAIEAEREACAKLAEESFPPETVGTDTRAMWLETAALEIAAAIRSRGQLP